MGLIADMLEQGAGEKITALAASEARVRREAEEPLDDASTAVLDALFAARSTVAAVLPVFTVARDGETQLALENAMIEAMAVEERALDDLEECAGPHEE